MVPAVIVLLLPVLPGCLIPYGFPKVDQTPLVRAENGTQEVHAFRVDVTRDFVDIGGTDQFTLSEVTFLPGGWVLPQTKISATYGCYVFGIVLNYPRYISHSLGLRLYRAGYELVELDSWALPSEIVWERVPDLAAQEKALDRLFLMNAEEALIGAKLLPGSETTEHRQVLIFGASEYDRLASTPAASGPENESMRHRLLSKAQELRELAAK
jgi:hypothetical protein